jgi:hypothetical protein
VPVALACLKQAGTGEAFFLLIGDYGLLLDFAGKLGRFNRPLLPVGASACGSGLVPCQPVVLYDQ